MSMAYPISQDVLQLFLNQERQVAEITMYGTDETIVLTEKDIRQGGLTVDRYCVSGSRIEIGSAVAAELALTLDNNDGRFDDTIFEGAELFVRIGVKKWNARRWEKATIHYIPLGYFTVDDSPRKLASISLSALDRMVMFDKEVNPSDLTFPIKIGDLLNRICDICKVSLAKTYNDLINYTYSVSSLPESENLTYRQILMWIAEITGTCAYIDWDGKLRLEWYSDNSSATLSPDMRFSSDLYDDAITLTGVRVVTDDVEYLKGDKTYPLTIESNGLIQDNAETIATNLNAKINGFSYVPYSCTAKPLIHLYPLDAVCFENKHGQNVFSIVTNVTYTMNNNVVLSGAGETNTSSGYAKANPLTKQESTIVSKIETDTDRKLNNREASILELNQIIANSIGLYRTSIERDDGSTVFYYHNATTLKDSSVIYTFREGGFAWTNEWNDDETVWQYGFTKDGNAVFNAISTYKIGVEYLNITGAITYESLSDDVKNTLTVTSDKISTIMHKNTSTSFNSTVMPTKANTDDYQKSILCFYNKKFYYYDDYSEEWLEYADEDNCYTMFEQTADGFNLKGDVVIDGSIVTTKNLVLSGIVTWDMDNSPVKAQYSVNKSSWHDTFTSGDMYMRMTFDGGSTWGEAVKVVGTDGRNGSNGSNGIVDYSQVNAILQSSYGITSTTLSKASISSPTIYSAELYSPDIYGVNLTLVSENAANPNIYNGLHLTPTSMYLKNAYQSVANENTKFYIDLGNDSSNSTIKMRLGAGTNSVGQQALNIEKYEDEIRIGTYTSSSGSTLTGFAGMIITPSTGAVTLTGTVQAIAVFG